jgi:CRP-like cAMP-binding protein
MAGRSSFVESLRTVGIFSDLSDKELGLVARSSTQITRPTGTVLMKEGDRGDFAAVLLEGTAVILRQGNVVRTIGAGTIIGELSLLDNGRRTATVSCGSECRLLVLTHAELRAVLDGLPKLRLKLLATLARMVRLKDDTLFS